MTVVVRFFARARDLAETEAAALDLPAGATVADLRRQLGAIYPRLRALLEHSALAVDNEFASDTLVLQPGIEVALLPPVSGG